MTDDLQTDQLIKSLERCDGAQRIGLAKSNLDFKKAIKLARHEALFPEELLDSADHLRELRNPFAHRRLSNREYTLRHRYITQQRHPFLILEEDARKVAAMYGHFKHTLRPA